MSRLAPLSDVTNSQRARLGFAVPALFLPGQSGLFGGSGEDDEEDGEEGGEDSGARGSDDPMPITGVPRCVQQPAYDHPPCGGVSVDL